MAVTYTESAWTLRACFTVHASPVAQETVEEKHTQATVVHVTPLEFLQGTKMYIG